VSGRRRAVSFVGAKQTYGRNIVASEAMDVAHFGINKGAFLEFVLAQYVSEGVEELD
jgi:hypothetical protein